MPEEILWIRREQARRGGQRAVAIDLVILGCGDAERASARRGICRQRHQLVHERGAQIVDQPK